jgi:hypothetical protein
MKALFTRMILTLSEAQEHVKASSHWRNRECLPNLGSETYFLERYPSSKNSASAGPGISPALTPRVKNS